MEIRSWLFWLPVSLAGSPKTPWSKADWPPPTDQDYYYHHQLQNSYSGATNLYHTPSPGPPDPVDVELRLGTVTEPLTRNLINSIDNNAQPYYFDSTGHVPHHDPVGLTPFESTMYQSTGDFFPGDYSNVNHNVDQENAHVHSTHTSPYHPFPAPFQPNSNDMYLSNPTPHFPHGGFSNIDQNPNLYLPSTSTQHQKAAEVTDYPTNPLPLKDPDLKVSELGDSITVTKFDTHSSDVALILEAIDGLQNLKKQKFIHFFVSTPHQDQVICVDSSHDSVTKFMTWFKLFSGKMVGDRKSVMLGNFYKQFNFVRSSSSIEPLKRIEIMISSYMKLVMNTEVCNWIEQKLERNPHSKSYLYQLFPVYFFYVDLITTIIPEGDLNGKLLQSRRNEAKKRLLELLEVMLLGGAMEKLPYPDFLKTRLLEPYMDKRFPTDMNSDIGRSFIWKALHYWIWNSRVGILNREPGQEPKEFSTQFKHFFSLLFLALGRKF